MSVDIHLFRPRSIRGFLVYERSIEFKSTNLGLIFINFSRNYFSNCRKFINIDLELEKGVQTVVLSWESRSNSSLLVYRFYLAKIVIKP